MRLPAGAIIVHDQDGKEYVLIPRDQFEAEPPQQKSQIERIMEVLDLWEPEPGDDVWWEEFRHFLKENPVTFGDPPDNVDDDE